MSATRYIGYDLNIVAAETIEGFCVADIYERPGRRWFNQKTEQYGEVLRKEDGELHFLMSCPACLQIEGHAKDCVALTICGND